VNFIESVRRLARLLKSSSTYQRQWRRYLDRVFRFSGITLWK